MPTLLFGLLLFLTPGALGLGTSVFRLRLSLLLLIAITTFLVPALLIVFLHRLGFVESLHMEELRDRRLPYFVTAIMYAVSTVMFSYRLEQLSELAPQIGIVLGSVTVSVALVALISLYWKISAHSVGISGMIGALTGIAIKSSEEVLFLPLLALIMLAGLLASARLHLNAHTPSQIGAGFGLGLAISLTAVIWFI
ncbi:hypothetical protein [Tellurirhabdus bombi]|uniref:hypothetical protein n=1 Tax=Tellurirhabdus bombi TaxID=2907205 RepID=UPI001F308083|nr:hypothetical protein [Tellurirhabdus bombi]